MSRLDKLLNTFRPPQYSVWLDYEKRGTVSVLQVEEREKLVKWLQDVRERSKNSLELKVLRDDREHKINMEITEIMRSNCCHPNIMVSLTVDQIRGEIICPLLNGEVSDGNYSEYEKSAGELLEIMNRFDSKLAGEWRGRLTETFKNMALIQE